MNKPKYQITQRAKKKMNKEIRASALQPDPILRTDTLKAADLVSHYPKKIQKKEKASLQAFNKKMDIVKKKKHSPHSKRTTPGTVDEVSAPHIIHVEGKRWIKTLESQTQTKRKVLQHQSLKKRGR